MRPRGFYFLNQNVGVADDVIELKDPGGEVVASDISEANFGPELSKIGRKLAKDPRTARNWPRRARRSVRSCSTRARKAS